MSPIPPNIRSDVDRARNYFSLLNFSRGHAILVAARAKAAALTEPDARLAALSEIARNQMKTGSPAGAAMTMACAGLGAAAEPSPATPGTPTGDARASSLDNPGPGAEAGNAAAARARSTAADRTFAYLKIAAAQRENGSGLDQPLHAAKACARQIADDPFLADAVLAKIAALQARAGNVPAAMATSTEIRDEYVSARACLAVARVRAHAEDLAGAKAALTAARAAGAAIGSAGYLERDSIYQGVALLQAKIADLAEAAATAEAIGDRPRQRHVYEQIDAAHAAIRSHGRARAAAMEFVEALAAACRVPDAHARASAYAGIAAGQAVCGDTAGAMATAREIREPAARSYAYIEIAKVRVQRRDITRAREALSGARLAIREIRSARIRVQADLLVADILLRMGQFSKARRRLRVARADAYRKADYEERDRLCLTIAEGQVRAGDVEGARKTCAHLMIQGIYVTLAPDAFLLALADAASIGRRAAGGDIAGAKALARQKEAVGAVQSHLAIARVEAESGAISAATATLAEAKSAAHRISNASSRAEAFLDIARELIAIGKNEQARVALAAGRLAATVIDGPYDSVCHLNIAGYFDDVVEMPPQDTPSSVYSPILSHRRADIFQTTLGKVEAFLALADAHRRIGDDNKARARLLSARDAVRHLPSAMDIYGTGCVETALAYVAIARAQTRIGDFGAAKATACMVHDNDNAANVCLMIARSRAAAGDVEGAKLLLATAKAAEYADPESDHGGILIHTDSTCAAIAAAQAQAGDIAGARATADTMGGTVDKTMARRRIAEATVEAAAPPQSTLEQ